MTTYEQVFANNRAWVESVKAQDADFFKKLSEGQNPEFLYIGCADSRVPANVIMGLEPGELFVHRNIANVVDNIDVNANSVIQYAVEKLGVKYVIVCGHYGCGGVQAAMKPLDLGLMNGWLRSIRDVYRAHKDELQAIQDEDQRFRRLVELNVEAQCRQVIKTSWVIKSFTQRGFPTVHGWVYDIADGLLKDLHVDFHGILEEVQEIYRLT